MSVAERPAGVDDELFPFESRFVTIDGHSVHYVDEGSGPTLLFRHGNPTRSFDHSRVIESLRQLIRQLNLVVNVMIPVGHRLTKPTNAQMADYQRALDSPARREAASANSHTHPTAGAAPSDTPTAEPS